MTVFFPFLLTHRFFQTSSPKQRGRAKPLSHLCALRNNQQVFRITDHLSNTRAERPRPGERKHTCKAQAFQCERQKTDCYVCACGGSVFLSFFLAATGVLRLCHGTQQQMIAKHLIHYPLKICINRSI